MAIPTGPNANFNAPKPFPNSFVDFSQALVARDPHTIPMAVPF